MAASRILVVDDEEHLAAGIRENLQAEGYETEVAHDGEQGLTMARDREFDLDEVPFAEQLMKPPPDFQGFLQMLLAAVPLQ